MPPVRELRVGFDLNADALVEPAGEAREPVMADEEAFVRDEEAFVRDEEAFVRDDEEGLASDEDATADLDGDELAEPARFAGRAGAVSPRTAPDRDEDASQDQVIVLDEVVVEGKGKDKEPAEKRDAGGAGDVLVLDEVVVQGREPARDARPATQETVPRGAEAGAEAEIDAGDADQDALLTPAALQDGRVDRRRVDPLRGPEPDGRAPAGVESTDPDRQALALGDDALLQPLDRPPPDGEVRGPARRVPAGDELMAPGDPAPETTAADGGPGSGRPSANDAQAIARRDDALLLDDEAAQDVRSPAGRVDERPGSQPKPAARRDPAGPGEEEAEPERDRRRPGDPAAEATPGRRDAKGRAAPSPEPEPEPEPEEDVDGDAREAGRARPGDELDDPDLDGRDLDGPDLDGEGGSARQEDELLDPDSDKADPRAQLQGPLRAGPDEIEAELAPEVDTGARGGADMRQRLEGVDRVAGGKRRAVQAEMDAQTAQLDGQEEAVRRNARSRSQRRAARLATCGAKRAGAARSRLTARKARKAASREELRTRLLAAQTAQKTKAEENLARKKGQLDEKLKAQFDRLVAEQKKQDEKMVAELAKRNAELGRQIEKKRAAHDAQIAKEKVALEKGAETERAAARAQAKKQSEDVQTSADKQAEQTLAHAEAQAVKVEASARSEAAAAKTAGEAKAKQATDAAEARVKSAADPGEETSIRAEGAARAAQARDQAKARAADIEAKGKREAAGIRDKGKTDAAAQKERGKTEAKAAIDRGEAGVKRIDGKLAAGIAAMKQKSDQAVAAMETERAFAMADLEQRRALAASKMATSQAEAVAVIDAERAKALTAMQAEHDALIAAIDTKIEADLEKLDSASDKDLARLEREIDRDIAEIEKKVARAERRMQAAVNRAEAKAVAEVARRRLEVRRAGREVLAAVDGVVAKARRKIDRADKDTSREISGAAAQGVADIAAEGKKVQADNRTATEKAIGAQETDAQKARDEATKVADSAAADMEKDRKALDGEIDKKWVDDAVAKAGTRLTRDGIFDAITDEESVDAMHVMASLPPHLQGQAINGLSDDQFGELLTEVPEARREHFDSLVENTHDPERKLALWGEYHKSKANQDAKRSGDDWREDIADDTEDEVDEEVEFLRQKLKDGSLTEQDVKDLASRKKLEHEIEMQYRVNVTNEEGARADGSKIVWTEGELEEMRATFAQMPDSHVRNNTDFKEIRREDVDEDEKDPANPRIGGDHSDGRIRVYDLGVSGSYRHTGDTRESSHPTATSDIGPGVGKLEEVIVHEVGHDIHDQNEETWEKFQQAAGWEKDLDTDEMKTRGLTQAQIDDMKDNGGTYTVGGKVYNYRYGEFVCFDEDRIPATGQGKDTWSYARNNYKDHFAETYMKAVVVPEQLARDLLDDPAARVTSETGKRDAARTARDTAQTDLDNLRGRTPPPSQAELDAATKRVTDAGTDLTKAQAVLDGAVADQRGLKQQYDIMRDEIFKTNVAAGQAEARLVARGVDPAKVADFRAKAARLSTPEQVERLERTY